MKKSHFVAYRNTLKVDLAMGLEVLLFRVLQLVLFKFLVFRKNFHSNASMSSDSRILNDDVGHCMLKILRTKNVNRNEFSLILS